MTQSRQQSPQAQAAEQLLSDVSAAASIDDLETVAKSLLADLARGLARVAFVRQNPSLGTQVARLRWMFADGRTPFVLVPSTAVELVTLARFAQRVAHDFKLPTVIALDAEVAESMNSLELSLRLHAATEPRLQRADAVPLRMGPDAALLQWQGLVCGNAEVLAKHRTDRQPAGEAKLDWLVISYGGTSIPAQAAVDQARCKNLGVDHLVLQTLSPLPERTIVAAAMGKRFVVVVERNVGQLHSEIQRLCPSLPVVLVSSAIEPVTPELVLGALLRFPRCC